MIEPSIITMSELGCCRPSRRWRRTRGFRVHTGRFSLHRLRFPFFGLIKLVKRWKMVCRRLAMASLSHIGGGSKDSTSCRWPRRRRRDKKSESSRSLVGGGGGVRDSRTEYKLRYHGRSNSFYADAIDECLEFIKRTSAASVDEGSTMLAA